MRSKKQHTDILIAGGGAPGLSLALLLAGQGLDIIIADPFTPPKLKEIKPDGRSTALLTSSLNVLKAAGLKDDEAGYGEALNAMRIIDDSVPGQESVWADFPANDIGQDSYGVNIPNRILTAALFEKAKAHKHIQFLNAGLADYRIEQNQVSARLEDKTQISAKLIVGADGRNSVTRQCAGIETSTKNYNQAAITCLINHSRSHQNIATEFHRPSGPLALVPLAGNQSTIVWVEKTERAHEIIALSKQDFTHALQTASKAVLGAITLETNPELWPLKTLKAKSLIAKRCALIAEAAHVMSPITAQGLNLSLRDVATLAEVIIDAARLGLDIGADSVLKNYEQRRFIDLKSRVSGVDSMMALVSTENPALKTIRRTGFKILDRAAPLRRFATTQALSPNLDPGRLVSGGSL